MCRRCNLLLSKVKYRDYWYSSLPAHTSKQVCREKPDLLHFPSHFVLWSFDGWILQQQYGIARQSARTPGTPRLGPLGGGRWTQTPPDSLSLSLELQDSNSRIVASERKYYFSPSGRASGAKLRMPGMRYSLFRIRMFDERWIHYEKKKSVICYDWFL